MSEHSPRSPGPIRDAPAKPPSAKAPAPSGRPGGLSNQAVQTELRSGAARRLGLAASEIEVEGDGGSAAGFGARGAASGNRVSLGPGADRTTLAHELVHVAQARRFGTGDAPASRRSDPAEQEARELAPRLLEVGGTVEVREQPAATWSKDEPEVVIVPMAAAGEPLAGYLQLKERLPPADWNALTAAARRRTETVLGQPASGANEAVSTEISVELQTIFETQVDECREAGGDQWLRDVFDAGMDNAQGAMAEIMQDEILHRWLNDNQGILQEPVTIALADPEGKSGGAGNMLVFTLFGQPVTPQGGVLTLGAVDRSFEGSAQDTVESMQIELAILSDALGKASRAEAMLERARAITGQGHDKIAAQALDQIDAALRGGLTALEEISGSPYAELVEPTATELSGFIGGTFATFREADQEWRLLHPRDKGAYEHTVDDVGRHLESQDRMLEEGSYMAAGHEGEAAMYAAMAAAFMNLVTGGAGEQKLRLGEAYDAGLISYESWSQGVDEADTRGYIFGGITAALTVATLGLGIWIGPSVGLGGEIALGVGGGMVTTAVPMLASNLYSSSVQFGDPMLQQWWQSGVYSGGDIAFATALGGGLGGAFPVAGRLLRNFGGQGARTVAALEAGAALPDGVIASSPSQGIVELSVASEGVTIRVTEEGYQVIGQAGKNPAAILDEGLWPAASASDDLALRSPRFELTSPTLSPPLALAEPDLGMLASPWRNPLQMELFPELGMLPEAGVLPGTPTASPLLLDAASGTVATPLASGEGVMILAEASLPHGLPSVPRLLAPGSAAQPMSLLDSVMPQISYEGPLVPPTFERSVTSQWGRHIAQRGTSALPYAGEGAVWVRMPSGEWGPAYYGYRPGGMPASRLTTYGEGVADFILDVPQSTRSGMVSPRPGGSFPGARGWPMPTSDMFDPRFAMTHGRGHIVPHAQTKNIVPGQISSTLDPHNFVAHPRKYNEWIRNNLEQMLKRENLTFTAHNVIGNNPRITQGGYIIPESEIFVAYDASGVARRAWRFPLADNPAYYETLSGSFKDVIGDFAINLREVPATPLMR